MTERAPALDFDGTQRPQRGRVDIGAFEGLKPQR
jgi:hypothetical protein